MENNEMNLLELYDKYLNMPLASPVRPTPLYDKGYVIHTGMAYFSPHPHRHYTFEEFTEAFSSNNRFKDFVITSPNPLT
jgi:hypothetical protein